MRRSQDSQSFDLAEESIREVFAQNNIQECDLSGDQVEEVNLAIQMATDNFVQLASLGSVFSNISARALKWGGSTVAIGTGCVAGVMKSRVFNTTDRAKSMSSWALAVGSTVLIVGGSLVSGRGGRMPERLFLNMQVKVEVINIPLEPI